MSYCTLENITSLIPMQELINLTNDETLARDVKEINTKQAENAISYADEIINSYLRNKYKLPLKFVPPILTQIAVDLTAFRLYSRRPRKLPEHIKDSYDVAINLLKNIQKETMILDLPHEHPDKEVSKPAPMILTNKGANSKIFSDDVMKGFRL